ncbi:MAG: TIGR00282 family metallophosphoesterase [Candidatus Aminicenantes bacterium]|nr:TIGR00282 family metallophosphoesterase [Candidatus Aminicenantes bacterium]
MPGSVRILFLGDLIGRPGRQALKRFLPDLAARHAPSFIVVNAENAAGGAGLTEDIGRELLAQADVLTSGNHIWDKKEVLGYLDREPRLLRPANYPPGNPGRGYGVFSDREGRKVGVLNLQGRVFMEPLDCPFRAADEAVERLRSETPVILVDIHAEATSEKQAMGWHLDGRVSAVIGTHTHVPTADEQILPGGTAYLTDAGMAGGRRSVIGIRTEQALARFLTAVPQRFEPGRDGFVLSAVFVEADADTGRALAVRRELLVEESHGD